MRGSAPSSYLHAISSLLISILAMTTGLPLPSHCRRAFCCHRVAAAPSIAVALALSIAAIAVALPSRLPLPLPSPRPSLLPSNGPLLLLQLHHCCAVHCCSCHRVVVAPSIAVAIVPSIDVAVAIAPSTAVIKVIAVMLPHSIYCHCCCTVHHCCIAVTLALRLP